MAVFHRIHFSAGHLALLFLVFAPAAAALPSQDCLVCHSRELTVQKGARTVSLSVDEARLRDSVHSFMSCADCHPGLNPAEIPHAKVMKPVECGSCHDTRSFARSVHGGAGKTGFVAECRACHGSAHEIRRVEDPKSPVGRTNVSGTCGRCHEEESRQYEASAHGSAVAGGNRSPTCVGCHGGHNILAPEKKESPLFKANQAGLCLKCHLEDHEIREQVGYSAGFIGSYEKSVHGVALASGNLESAGCSDCHGSHDQKGAGNPSSRVNKQNIAQTCSRCHEGNTKEYNESVHGRARQKGNVDAPTCTDCHGEHEILPGKDPRSLVAPGNVSSQVCAACHNSVRLNKKYGLTSEQFDSFQDSYHGLAGRAGSVEVANCASCHGGHDIKRSSDPDSTIHKSNLAATCGKCHPGAGENFAKGAVHVVINRASAGNGERILRWIQNLYILLIIVIIGSMFLHNLLDFLRKMRDRAARPGAVAPEPHGSGKYLRMGLSERIQHCLMFSSFIVLAITGFVLKYPDAWWVVPFRHVSGEYFAVRSLLHRIAGVVLIGVSVYHLLYIFYAKRGKQLVRDMLPKWKDAADAWANLGYLTGISKKKPRFDRFGYAEKSEYWALFWGVIVMSASGIVMWFDTFFMGLFTKLGWDIARTIHFWEACLATLAVVVCHFYFVILNPDVYPMNTTWITGEISERQMAEEHPLELERIRAEHPAEETQDAAFAHNAAGGADVPTVQG